MILSFDSLHMGQNSNGALRRSAPIIGTVISVVRIQENVIVFFFQKRIKVFYSQ